MKYCVAVRFEGVISFDVEAESEVEAKAAAIALFDEEDDRTIVAEIASIDVCDICEED